MVRVCRFGCFSEVDDPRPVRGLAEMIGGDPSGDRKGPRLELSPSFESGQTTADADQGLLEEIFGEVGIPAVSS
jgi:hypothetical protein